MVKISVSIVVSLAMLLAMAVAALIAFFPTHEAGLTSVRDSIEVVRKNVLGRVVNGVEQFFKVPGSQLDTFKSNYNAGALNMTDDETVVKLLCSLVRDQREILTGAFLYSEWSVMGCDQRLGPTIGGILHTTNGTGVMPVYSYNLSSLDYVQPKTPLLSLPWDVKGLWDIFNVVTNFSSSRNRWSSGQGYTTINFVGMTGLDNLVTNTLQSRLVLYLYPKQLEPLLQSLGVGENGRVLLADGFNKNVFGTSWGEAAERLGPNWQTLPIGHPARMQLLDVTDMQDPMVSRVIQQLGGKNGFYATISLSTTMFEGSDKVFVDLRTLTDSYQLDVKVLIILRERDYTETIIERQKSTIGAVCGALVGMLLLSVIFAVLLTRPLKRLGFRMYKTASLQDEEEDDPPSLLSEIASMQVAYVAMKRELNRIKSYLPQSLLEGNDDDEEEEDDEEASKPSSGKITPQTKSIEPSIRSSARSHNSKHSSSRSSANGGAVVGLNTARAIHRRRVAVATFNLVGFHTVSQQSSPATMTNMQSKYLTICSKNVRDSKGFVDSFQGDHVFASFNAVATVATPAKRAVLAAIAAAKELSETPLMPQFTAGVAVSAAAAGNMGSDAMVRFNVVGPVCAQSQAMERLARQRLRSTSGDQVPYLRCTDNALIAITQDVISDVQLEIETQYFDIVTMGGKPRLVAFAGNARKMAADEWMYQLDNAAKGDQYQASNDALLALLDSDKSEASKHLEEVGSSPMPAELSSRFKELAEAADVVTAATNIQYEL